MITLMKQLSCHCKLTFIPYGYEWKPMVGLEVVKI